VETISQNGVEWNGIELQSKAQNRSRIIKVTQYHCFFPLDSKVDQGHRQKFAEARQILVNRSSEANCWTGFTYQSSTLKKNIYTGDKSDVFAQYPM